MFITKFIVCGAIASFANAASLTNTAGDFSNVKAGQPFTINWSGANGPVTLLLKDGPSNNLRTVKTLASGVTGNSFTWTPEASLPKENYAIEIQDASGPNYSVQFPISGGTGSASSPDHAHQVSSSAPAATGSYLPSSGYVSYTSSHSNGTTLTSSPVYISTPIPSYTPSASANATESLTSESKSHTPTHSSASPSPSDTNDAADATSPVAFVLLAFAAFIFLQ